MKDKSEKIISTYKSTVYGIALSHMGNRFEADDVFQEVFFAYFRIPRVFTSEEHRKAWIIKTTLNQCKKQYREKLKSGVELYDGIEDDEFRFEIDEENAVFSALKKLPEKYKTALYLFYFEELSCEQISKITKTSEGSVRVRLNRGRKLMKELLKGDFYELSTHEKSDDT